MIIRSLSSEQTLTLGCIMRDGYKNTAYTPKSYLGYRQAQEKNGLISMTILFKSDKELNDFIHFWSFETNYGQNEISLESPYFGDNSPHKVRFINDPVATLQSSSGANPDDRVYKMNITVELIDSLENVLLPYTNDIFINVLIPNNGTFTLPVVSGANINYDFVVLWGDGTSSKISSATDPEVTHTYTLGGEFTIRITGVFEGFSFTSKPISATYVKTAVIENMTFKYYKGMFDGCLNMTKVIFTGDNDTFSGNLDFSGMFRNASALTTIENMPISQTTAPVSLSEMFSGASSLSEYPPLELLDTSNTTDMSGMFENGPNIAPPADIKNWVTTNVQDMSRMFKNATNMTVAPTENWDTALCTNFSEMFSGCVNLTCVPYIDTTASGAIKTDMFKDCTALLIPDTIEIGEITSTAGRLQKRGCNEFGLLIDVTSTDEPTFYAEMNGVDVTDKVIVKNVGTNLWTISSGRAVSWFKFTPSTGTNAITSLYFKKATDIKSMESVCEGLSNVTSLKIDYSFNTANCANYKYAFKDMAGVTTFASAKLKYGNAITVEGLFMNCTGVTGNLNYYHNFSKVEVFKDMFRGMSNLTSPPQLLGIDVSSGRDFSGMFAGMEKVSYVTPIKDWDMSNAEDVSEMFMGVRRATSFPKLGRKEFKNLKRASKMFFNYGADVEPYNGEAVIDLRYWESWQLVDTSSMFENSNATKIVLWGATPIACDMSRMFAECQKLLTVAPINTLSATSTTDMFLNTPSLIRPTAPKISAIIGGALYAGEAIEDVHKTYEQMVAGSYLTPTIKPSLYPRYSCIMVGAGGSGLISNDPSTAYGGMAGYADYVFNQVLSSESSMTLIAGAGNRYNSLSEAGDGLTGLDGDPSKLKIGSTVVRTADGGRGASFALHQYDSSTAGGSDTISFLTWGVISDGADDPAYGKGGEHSEFGKGGDAMEWGGFTVAEGKFGGGGGGCPTYPSARGGAGFVKVLLCVDKYVPINPVQTEANNHTATITWDNTAPFMDKVWIFTEGKFHGPFTGGTLTYNFGGGTINRYTYAMFINIETHHYGEVIGITI